jgi:hypothetical protein
MPIMSDYLNVLGTQFYSQSKKNKLDRIIYGDIIGTWIEHAKDRQTIVFAPSIDESKLIADEFQMFGINATHVDGSTMDQESRLEKSKFYVIMVLFQKVSTYQMSHALFSLVKQIQSLCIYNNVSVPYVSEMI